MSSAHYFVKNRLDGPMAAQFIIDGLTFPFRCTGPVKPWPLDKLTWLLQLVQTAILSNTFKLRYIKGFKQDKKYCYGSYDCVIKRLIYNPIFSMNAWIFEAFIFLSICCLNLRSNVPEFKQEPIPVSPKIWCHNSSFNFLTWLIKVT